MANTLENTVKRVNYYDHQFLKAPDFVDEQNYHLNSRRRHNRALHTWGIVQGLTVTVASGGTGTAVTVSAGFAVDSQGREIVLPADTNLELGGEAAGNTPLITIAYAELQSDPTTETGGPGNTRISEIPNLSFSEVVPTDKSMTLILARVPRTNTGLGAVDRSDRIQAGVVLGSDLTVKTLTLTKDGLAQANWPALSCGGANQVAFANAGLSVSGRVSIGPAAADHHLSVNAAGGAGVYANLKNASHELLLGVETAAVLSAMTDSDLKICTNNVPRMTIAKGDGHTHIQSMLTVGPLALPTATGRIMVTGANAELGFAKRSLTAWASSPAAGDRYIWYNPDGNAKLWTEVHGDLLTVTPDGNTHIQSTLSVGPLALPTATGRIMVTGANAELGFAKRSLTAWAASPAAGDRYVWYNPDGNAKLWTEVNGDLLTVTPNGFVGIGTVPTRTLDVKASGGIKLGLEGNGGGQLILTNNANDNMIYLEGFNAAGTGSAQEILLTGANADLIGTIFLGAHNLLAGGAALKPGGGAWGDTSDEALKTNIKPMSGVLDKLLSLRGVTFNWKEPEKHGNLTGTQRGFVAQEVEGFFPEWVGRDSAGFMTLSIRGFEALAVEAFRELRDEIKALKEAIADSKFRLETPGH